MGNKLLVAHGSFGCRLPGGGLGLVRVGVAGAVARWLALARSSGRRHVGGMDRPAVLGSVRGPHYDDMMTEAAQLKSPMGLPIESRHEAT